MVILVRRLVTKSLFDLVINGVFVQFPFEIQLNDRASSGIAFSVTK